MTTNDIELVTTNAVQVVSRITPQSAAWEFKQWMGVVLLVAASIHSAFVIAFPKIQAFLDTRYGGAAKGMFNAIFGSDTPPTIKPTPIDSKLIVQTGNEQEMKPAPVFASHLNATIKPETKPNVEKPVEVFTH